MGEFYSCRQLRCEKTAASVASTCPLYVTTYRCWARLVTCLIRWTKRFDTPVAEVVTIWLKDTCPADDSYVFVAWICVVSFVFCSRPLDSLELGEIFTDWDPMEKIISILEHLFLGGTRVFLTSPFPALLKGHCGGGWPCCALHPAFVRWLFLSFVFLCLDFFFFRGADLRYLKGVQVEH